MLQDIDLSYDRTGALTTSRNVKIGGTLTVAGNPVAAPSTPQPADHGLIAWSSDPNYSSGTAATVNGTLYLAAVFVRASVNASKIWWINTTAGNTPTAGQNFAGLYNSAGTLLASTGVDTQASSNSIQSASITPTPLTPGFYWVALLFNATTAPTLARTVGFTATSNNLNLTAASYRYAVAGTLQTAMPSSITPTSNSLTGAFALTVAIS